MIDPEQFEPNQEIEGIVRSAFQIQDPDHSFIDRLQKQLIDQFIDRYRSGQAQEYASQAFTMAQPDKTPILTPRLGCICLYSDPFLDMGDQYPHSKN